MSDQRAPASSTAAGQVWSDLRERLEGAVETLVDLRQRAGGDAPRLDLKIKGVERALMVHGDMDAVAGITPTAAWHRFTRDVRYLASIETDLAKRSGLLLALDHQRGFPMPVDDRT